MFPMKDTCCNAHQENDLFGTSFTWERKLWEYFGIVYVFSLNNCMFWTPWNAIKHTKAYKNICVLGLNLINIIIFMKTIAYFVVVVVAFFKEFWCPEYEAVYFTELNFSIFFVFYLLFISTTICKKISTVCKIRCLCTQKGEKSCIICYKKSLWKKMFVVRIFNIYMKLSFEYVSFLTPPKCFGLVPFEIVLWCDPARAGLFSIFVQLFWVGVEKAD